MLSRVADSLYWMSRYLERAEHTARVLDVNLHGLLDQKPDVVERRWKRVLQSLYARMPHGRTMEPQTIAHTLFFDPAVTDSIVNCIGAARHNTREIREQISTEMWEQINRLYLHLQRTNRNGVWDAQAHNFFQEVKEGAHLFQGITDTTMSHEEGWYFIQLGRYMERVMATTNLLASHFEDYGYQDETSGAVDLYMEWVGLLKSCTAFEAYCRLYTANIVPEKVISFLLLHSDFPHSIRFGVGMILKALEELSESIPALKHSEALRLSGKLASSLQFDPIDEIMAADVHSYLDGIRSRCIQIHQGVYDTCITYPVELALTV